MSSGSQPEPPRGRGAVSRPASRYLSVIEVPDAEQLEYDEDRAEDQTRLKTVYYRDTARSVISENNSPDIPFRYSLNPYRGCQHGCSYCYARPSHEFLGLSPGLDFETKIFVKTDAATLLRDWMNRPRYACEVFVMSGITDCYQPVERALRITRQCLEVTSEARHPVSVITKNALVTRDIDLLSRLAEDNLTRVAISITSLDADLSRQMEPRCSAPHARLQAIRELAAAGIPVHAMLAPVIPGLNDSEIPQIVAAVAEAGAVSAGLIMLRLPQAVDEVFLGWLRHHRPSQAAKVEQRLRAVRDGRLNTAEFGVRMRGTGIHAEQIAALFQLARRRAGLDAKLPPLTTDLFVPPRSAAGQGRLF